jgi:predicted Zn-dependent protease
MKRLFLPFSALLSLVLIAACAVVPETGRRQLMLVSSADEARMGLTAFEQIKKEEKISQDVEAVSQVQRVGNRIAASVGRDLENAEWEFVVFESDQINAFALPGGKVGVYTGLLKLVESDDELATVMGHEIAHVTSRHGAERASQQYAIAGVGLASAVGMEAKDVDPAKRNAILAAYGVGSTVLLTLPYSRLHETEADAVGLRFAAGAGYDPRAAAKFWRKMVAANKDRARPPEFLSSHPAEATRIKTLEELAPKYMPLYEAAKERMKRERESG